MFDLNFYLMIKYFFEYHNNELKHFCQKVLSRRGHQDYKKEDERLLLIKNKKEQLDNYRNTRFLLYLSDYENYF